ncbi:hypothetical protein EBZ39_11215, partial [bacterium]|nr:hypothetical protein [bacterium]
MKDLILELHQEGIHVLPLQHNGHKFIHPNYSSKFDTGFSTDEIMALLDAGYDNAYAVMHGKCNPFLKALDFDEKNAPGKDLYATWSRIIDPDLLSKLVIEKTRSAGYHVYFFCPAQVTEKALASSATGSEWIACRSAANNCVTYAAPSPGYEYLQGSLFDLQMLTPDEMAQLCDVAKQLDEYTGEKNTKSTYLPAVQVPAEYSAAITKFDADCDASFILDLLRQNGWTIGSRVHEKPVNGEKWQYVKVWRPQIEGVAPEMQIELPKVTPMAFPTPTRGGQDVWRVEVKGIIEWAENAGYRWMRMSSTDDTVVQLVRVVDNIIYHCDEKDLQRLYREEVARNYAGEHESRVLLAFMPQIMKYMAALPNFEGTLMRDERHASYIYFSNGALRITRDNVELNKYTDLPGCVFSRNIKSFEYRQFEGQGDFGRFLKNVAHDDDHLRYMMSCLGYMLHDYKLRNFAKALMMIEDVEDQDEARGRSGKGLIAQFYESVRTCVQQDGRNYKSDSQFKMQQVVPGVQGFHLNDPAPTILMNQFYNYITDDWLVEAKGKKSYTIPFRMSPKIMITTNYLPNLESDSDKDRFIIMSIKKHYGSTHSLRDDFPGTIFFSDEWTNDQWMEAMNVAIMCIQLYLKHGVISYTNTQMDRNNNQRLIKTLVPESIIDTIE